MKNSPQKTLHATFHYLSYLTQIMIDTFILAILSTVVGISVMGLAPEVTPFIKKLVNFICTAGAIFYAIMLWSEITWLTLKKEDLQEPPQSEEDPINATENKFLRFDYLKIFLTTCLFMQFAPILAALYALLTYDFFGNVDKELLQYGVIILTLKSILMIMAIPGKIRQINSI